jgi:hypothetical protein
MAIELEPIVAPAASTATGNLTPIHVRFAKDGEPIDPTSVVLSSESGLWGVRRMDTGAVVVSDSTAMSKIETGHYEYFFTDPAYGLTYEYAIEALIDGVVYRKTGTISGGVADLRDIGNALDPFIQPEIGGVPIAFLHLIQRRVFRDFCAHTKLWRYRYDTVTVIDEDTYEIVLPQNTIIKQLESVTLNETEPVSVYELEPEDTSITFVEDPGIADVPINIVTQIVPTLACTNAPNWIIQRHGDTLCAGVVFYLKGITDRPWFDPKGLVFSQQRWLAGIGEARRERFESRCGQRTARISGIIV